MTDFLPNQGVYTESELQEFRFTPSAALTSFLTKTAVAFYAAGVAASKQEDVLEEQVQASLFADGMLRLLLTVYPNEMNGETNASFSEKFVKRWEEDAARVLSRLGAFGRFAQSFNVAERLATRSIMADMGETFYNAAEQARRWQSESPDAREARLEIISAIVPAVVEISRAVQTLGANFDQATVPWITDVQNMRTLFFKIAIGVLKHWLEYVPVQPDWIRGRAQWLQYQLRVIENWAARAAQKLHEPVQGMYGTRVLNWRYVRLDISYERARGPRERPRNLAQ